MDRINMTNRIGIVVAVDRRATVLFRFRHPELVEG